MGCSLTFQIFKIDFREFFIIILIFLTDDKKIIVHVDLYLFII